MEVIEQKMPLSEKIRIFTQGVPTRSLAGVLLSFTSKNGRRSQYPFREVRYAILRRITLIVSNHRKLSPFTTIVKLWRQYAMLGLCREML